MFEKKSVQSTDVKVVTVLGEGTLLEGNFTAKDSTRVDGQVNGDIICSGSLIVGERGRIYGNIQAKNVFCSGQVTGDITVESKIEVTETAKIIGNLDTVLLVVDEKAIIHGNCNMHVAVSKKDEENIKVNKRANPKKTVSFPEEEKTEERVEEKTEETSDPSDTVLKAIQSGEEDLGK